MIFTILLYSTSAAATRRYVDAASTASSPNGLTWATAYTKFEDAVTAAVSGDVIWVAKGTYQPAYQASYTLKAGVEIYGGFTNTDTDISQRNWETNLTKLKGNGNRVFYNSYVAGAPVLDGFTISDGVNGFGYGGGGMCNENSSPILTNIIFRDNHVISVTGENHSLPWGGGMYNVLSSPILTNVKFINNSSFTEAGYALGGGMYNNYDSFPVLNNVIFSGNTSESTDATSYAMGAGICNVNASPKYNNVIFEKNVCKSTGRTYGGAIGNSECLTQSLLTNVVFDGNEAYYGAAMYSNKSNVLVAQSTFANNISTTVNNSTAFITQNSTAKLTNCVFFHNAFDLQIFTQVSTIIRNTYVRLITNDATVSGNILSYLSPFVNEGNPKGPDGIWLTADDGLRLAYAADKPAIDMGENITSEFYPAALVSAVATDVRGVARPVGPAYDMGAYEGGVDKSDVFVDAANTAEVQDGLSWATAFNKLEKALDADAFGSGGAIWVAKGTYQPAEGKSYSLLPLSRVYGGFKNTDTEFNQRDWVNNKTILLGNGSQVIYNDGLVSGSYNNNKTELDGFTITGGKGGDKGGGAMYFYYSAPNVSNSIIDGNEADASGGAIYFLGMGAWFRNVTFKNNRTGGDGGVIYTSGTATFENVTFSNNTAAGHGGVMTIDRGTGVAISNAVFESNTAAFGGVFAVLWANLDVTNAVFIGNNATTDGAVLYNNYGTTARITNATFLNNTAATKAVYTDMVSPIPVLTASIKNSIFRGGASFSNVAQHISYSISGTTLGGTANEVKTTSPFVNEALPKGADGIWFTADDGLQLAYDVDTSPATAINTGKTIVDADGNGTITDVAGKDITGFPRPSGVGYDKGAYEYRYPAGVASHLYVDASNTADLRDGKTWSRAYSKLDLALADPGLRTGTELWVAKGTYQPTSGSSFVMKEGVGIYGGMPNTSLQRSEQNFVENPTILKGNGKAVINNTFTEGNPMTEAAVLDGFTIRDGTATVQGGGIYNKYASPTLRNLIVKNNSSGQNGGGLSLINSSSQLFNVRIDDNQAMYGAGMEIMSGSPTMINVIFSKNVATGSGGGISSSESSYRLINVVFDQNKATDFYGAGGGIFSSNEAGPSILNNVIFYGNEADFGGGINGEWPNLTNVTFYKNIGNQGGGAANLYTQTSTTAVITNSVFWGNTDGDSETATPDIYSSGQDVSVNYNFTQSDFSSSGTGNIQGTSSPFVNEIQPMGPDGIWFTEDDGLQLSSCSPALDKGSNIAADDISIDILEQSRKTNGTVDMGAYEKQSITTPGQFASNAALSLSSANDLDLLPTCDDNGWTFYADPTKTNDFVFAINWSTGNETAKAAATVKIKLAETNTSVLTSDKGIVAMRRYWNVDLHATTLVNPVQVRFYYDAADITAMENTVTNASLFKKNNQVKWFKTTNSLYAPSQITATDINAGARIFLTPILGADNNVAYAQFDEVSSFSGGTAVILAEKTPSLPVTLISFQAKATEQGSNLITWNTASEKNFSHFEIQHSKDAKAFSTLSNVTGTQAQSYQYIHTNPSGGINYYRLRMVDNDNSFAYSRTISVANGEAGQVAGNIYPNPTSGKNVYIDLLVNEAGTWQIVTYNVAGVLLNTEVINLKAGPNIVPINIKGLPAGVHLIRFRNQHQQEFVRKIAVNK